MRALILVAGAALCLAACRNNDQADNTANVDENLAAENIVSNDVTAIDAVTGADANMAADVNYINEVDTSDGLANGSSSAPKPAKPAEGNSTSPVRRTPSTAPVTNSTTTATTNNAI